MCAAIEKSKAPLLAKNARNGAPRFRNSVSYIRSAEAGRVAAYDCFSIVNDIVVPCCLSLYSALIDLPSVEIVMR